jgi:hypothetical protein
VYEQTADAGLCHTCLSTAVRHGREIAALCGPVALQRITKLENHSNEVAETEMWSGIYCRSNFYCTNILDFHMYVPDLGRRSGPRLSYQSLLNGRIAVSDLRTGSTAGHARHTECNSDCISLFE